MSANTSIEWCDHTFNPWEGCTKVGPGCDNCYAEARNARFAGGMSVNWGPGAPRRRTSASNWAMPLRWNAEGKMMGRRFRVFCASLADVFDNEVDPAWRADLFTLIRDTPNLDWLLLTKRIGNVPAMLNAAVGATVFRGNGNEHSWPWPNVWLGATIVNQEEADRDIPKLQATPARVRFLSMEPLLGAVDLHQWIGLECRHEGSYMEADTGACICRECDDTPLLDWVIVGGENGPHARPMHPDWARSLRDQCAAAGVPFLFKQVGEAVPVETDVDTDHGHTVYPLDDSIELPGDRYKLHTAPSGQYFVRVPNKAAGRLLDGVTHDGYPEIVA